MLNQILDRYINNESGTGFSNYTPEGISGLMEVLGNPHKEIRTVHVAGTNGKGTVCHIMAQVLQNAGYRTGLFISPHLLKINERISINSAQITDEELLKYVIMADRAASETGIAVTYFDILTASAFCYFRDNSTEIAIIETGLGGRLDSTNIITPLISVITDISMDHLHILGDSITAITSEKCGIIKPEIPVITSNTDEDIVNQIRETASRTGSPFYSFNSSFHIDNLTNNEGYFSFRVLFDNEPPFLIELPLFPEHHVKNAASAAAALILLKKNFNAVKSEIIVQTLKKIRIPGRFEKLSSSPPLYFDPAHNISSLKNLFKGVDAFYPSRKKIFVITMMKDKITEEVQSLLEEESRSIIYYIKDDPRVYIPLKDQFSLVTGDRRLIINQLKSDTNNETLIIFTGSFRIYDFAVEAAHSISRV